jgi:uncharacterized protein YqeY
MSLLEEIRKDQLQARKEHAFGVPLLTTLIGEAQMPGKNAGRESTDEEVLGIIKKFISNLDEVIKILGKNQSEFFIDERLVHAQTERMILMKYVPIQKTEAELRVIITEYIDILGEKSPKQMGKVMGMLKTEYSGRYDGTLASKLVKELLQN